jgi:hypothetical protein
MAAAPSVAKDQAWQLYHKLKQMQLVLNESEISVKEPYAVRWMGLRNAVQAVHDCYPSILATLAADKNSTA